MRLLRLEPDGEELISVPEIGHARVGEDPRVEGRAAIAGEDGHPDREDVELRVRVLVEDVLADPTGPGAAGWSGGRDEQDESWDVLALVEEREQRGLAFRAVAVMA